MVDDDAALMVSVDVKHRVYLRGLNVLRCRADILGTNWEDGKGVEVYSCYPITAVQVARRSGMASELRVRQKERRDLFIREDLNTRV